MAEVEHENISNVHDDARVVSINTNLYASLITPRRILPFQQLKRNGMKRNNLIKFHKICVCEVSGVGGTRRGARRRTCSALIINNWRVYRSLSIAYRLNPTYKSDWFKQFSMINSLTWSSARCVGWLNQIRSDSHIPYLCQDLSELIGHGQAVEDFFRLSWKWAEKLELI